MISDQKPGCTKSNKFTSGFGEIPTSDAAFFILLKRDDEKVTCILHKKMRFSFTEVTFLCFI